MALEVYNKTGPETASSTETETVTMSDASHSLTASSPATVRPPVPRLSRPIPGSDGLTSPSSMAARIDALEGEVIYLAKHLGEVVAHLANGRAASEIPQEPSPEPTPEPTQEMGGVAQALAALTPEQKAALRSLLGG